MNPKNLFSLSLSFSVILFSFSFSQLLVFIQTLTQSCYENMSMASNSWFLTVSLLNAGKRNGQETVAETSRKKMDFMNFYNISIHNYFFHSYFIILFMNLLHHLSFSTFITALATLEFT